jgi:hypothetical protein
VEELELLVGSGIVLIRVRSCWKATEGSTPEIMISKLKQYVAETVRTCDIKDIDGIWDVTVFEARGWDETQNM